MTTVMIYFILVPLISLILLGVNFAFATHTPYNEKNSVFECGFHSFLGQNRTQFSISFFIFALLFLLFDLEILLIYPYGVTASTNEIYGLSIMLIFFLVLTLGFTFEIGKNALKIDSKQYINPDVKILKDKLYYLVKLLQDSPPRAHPFIVLPIQSGILTHFLLVIKKRLSIRTLILFFITTSSVYLLTNFAIIYILPDLEFFNSTSFYEIRIMIIMLITFWSDYMLMPQEGLIGYKAFMGTTVDHVAMMNNAGSTNNNPEVDHNTGNRGNDRNSDNRSPSNSGDSISSSSSDSDSDSSINRVSNRISGSASFPLSEDLRDQMEANWRQARAIPQRVLTNANLPEGAWDCIDEILVKMTYARRAIFRHYRMVLDMAELKDRDTGGNTHNTLQGLRESLGDRYSIGPQKILSFMSAANMALGGTHTLGSTHTIEVLRDDMLKESRVLDRQLRKLNTHSSGILQWVREYEARRAANNR